MLSVMIECGEDAGALAVTLAGLVPGAIEGLVREVVVLDHGMDAGTRKVADHAGCRLAPASALRSALAGAKGEWLLLLEPGARLGPEWVEAVSGHLSEVMAGGAPKPARFTASHRDRPPLLKRLSWRRRPLVEGVVLTRGEAVERSGTAESLSGLAKGLRTLRLDTSIRPRPAS